MVTAAMEEIPDALLARLEPGGVLIAPVGPMDDTQMLTRVVRNGDAFDRQELMAVRFVPALQGVAREL
jgi:protein-L-isoaspartate(D-aspartate) O-methyltransferase